jgi:hypothetical protein
MLVVWTPEGSTARLVAELLVAELTAVQRQLDEKRACGALAELRQVAATRTERRTNEPFRTLRHR